MKTIPIYDASAPIACTAGSSEIAARIKQIERMRTSLQGIERTEHGVLMRFPNRRDVEADVRQFTIAEKACCQFWGFDITLTAAEIRLRWDAPPALDDAMDRLLERFRGDEPITASGGLL